jgi:phospholipase C
VCSETFDHTSIIRFIEQRFGVTEPNITPWRRAVCGDLTSAFDFSGRKSTVPSLPDTSTYEPHDHDRHADYHPTPPTRGELPRQERGTRPARPLGYDVDVVERPRDHSLGVDLVNRGRLGAQFQARFLTPVAPPRSYTVGARDRLSAAWPVSGAYDITLHGPHGLFRRLTGDSADDHVEATIRTRGAAVVLTVRAKGRSATVTLTNGYGGRTRTVTVPTGRERDITVETRSTGGWYDVRLAVSGHSFAREFAGHLEDGRPSISDPAFGR